MKNRPFRERLGFALAGIRAGWQRESSFRTQTVLAACALVALIDLLHPGIHPAIRIAKDMLAGAVLVMSIAALVVGVAMIVDAGPDVLKEIGW